MVVVLMGSGPGSCRSRVPVSYGLGNVREEGHMRTISFCVNWGCSQQEQLPAGTVFLSTPTPLQSGRCPALPASVCSFPPVTNANAAERGLRGALALPIMPCL